MQTANLKEEIAKRKEFLAKIIAFSETFVLEKGTITERGTSCGCSTVKRELKNFGGFSFIWDIGHYPGGDYIEIFDAKGHEPLSFKYNNDDYEVFIFDPDDSWQAAVLKTIDRKDEIVKEMMAAEERERKALRTKTKQEEISASLEKEAKKLKIT